MTPIRVAHLVSTLGVGGQEMVIHSLVKHTDRRRAEPVVLALHEEGPLADRIRGLGVPVETVGRKGAGRLVTVRRLAERLRQLKIDVLHTHNPAPHQHGAAARRLAGIPVMLHTKHGRNYYPTRPGRWAAQLATRYTDRVVAVSADAADYARRIDRVPEHKLQVIHNGIAVPDAPRATTGQHPTPRLVHVARLNRIKDQETLLRATRLLVDRLPGVTLDIVGDGPMNQILRGVASQLHLDDVVRFHGMRDNVADYLASADLFVLSSLSEGVSITLLEAMAAGLPVVATDVGGNREVVVDGQTGRLVPVGAVEQMAATMRDLLTDPTRAREMGAAGFARVRAEFNIENTAQRYLDAYGELLAHATGRNAA